MMALSFVMVLSFSCEFIDNLIHDDEVVARVGKHKLYRSTVENYLPKDISSEDSLSMVQQYINSWATELIFVDQASKGLTKEEKDLDVEIEDYRNSLLRFRFEQKYVNEHLDTLVTSDEIREYWENHKEMFILDAPVAMARIMDIGKTSASLEDLTLYMTSSDESDLELADNIAFGAAFVYADHSSVWLGLGTLCKELGVDMAKMLPLMGKEKLATVEEEGGDLKMIYAVDYAPAGVAAPLGYCGERIKDIILNTRKRALVSDLERDLLIEARDNEHLKIY